MSHLEVFKRVLKLEADSILASIEKVDEKELKKLVSLFEFLKTNGGNLVICGVGKSGIIATKMASTFTSLGLPSFFLHPTEALHGDLGRVNENDAIVLISKSGTTEEIFKLLPFLKIPKTNRIGLVGDIKSSIAKECEIVFDCSVEKEACKNNQAPTTSSTLALAFGDAMAMVYEHIVGLSKEGFALNHPGGILGKSLRVKVRDLMWKIDDCPVVDEMRSLQDVIIEMTRLPVGGCAVVDGQKKLLGIVVDGDIRRALSNKGQGLQVAVKDMMTKQPVSIGPEELAFEALKLMEQRKSQITILPVVEDGKFLGFIRLHDLLKEGFSFQA